MCVIFFDVSKALDTVPHSVLLAKLCELSLNPYLLRCYLSDLSVCASMVSVPASSLFSVLGPLLNVATVISPSSDANMFADDIALYRVIKSMFLTSTLCLVAFTKND